MLEYKTVIGENGRLVIPAKLRKAIGIEQGQQILLRMENNEIKISTMKNTIERIQNFVKSKNSNSISLVQELFNLRREDKSE